MDDDFANYHYQINDVSMIQNGITVEQIPQKEDFDIKIDIENTQQDIADVIIVVACYDKGKLVNLKSIEITEDVLLEGYALTHVKETYDISSIKVCIWGSLTV